jgi:hypothetical protein
MNAPQITEPLPERMRGLPRDHRGFVVPYFVAWMKDGYAVPAGQGEPDFRIIHPGVMQKCKRERRCWCCGQILGRFLVFAIGPMCALSRTTMEPPAHLECARYSVRVCPFLSRPKMRRNVDDMPEGHWAPGVSITRNPGVTALWVTRSYTTFRAEDGGGTGTPGELITVGEPERVEWWAEGRAATRAEVLASIDSGLPLLREQADKQDAQYPPLAPDNPRSARYALEREHLPRLAALLPT